MSPIHQNSEAVSVVSDGNGFHISLRSATGETQDVQGLWSGVVLATAYKKNYFAFEIICVRLQMSSGKAVELSESDEGFGEFAARMTQRLTDVDRNWLQRLMEKPADGTVQTLFRKGWM